MKLLCTMFKTELKLSLRGMDMFIFAVCVPLAVLILIGVIYGNKPAYDGADFTFLQQSFGALSTISICAGGVMGLPLVVSDYRSKHILKRFRVTPISPMKILIVQVVIYILYALVSLMSLYLVACIFFDYRFSGSWIRFLCSYLLVMFSMFSIGMMIGGIAPNSRMASVIASILYFPMLIFSGATLPYEIMPQALQTAADIMPLTQGIKLLKLTSLGLAADSAVFPIVMMCLLAIVCTGISIRYFRWE